MKFTLKVCLGIVYNFAVCGITGLTLFDLKWWCLLVLNAFYWTFILLEDH